MRVTVLRSVALAVFAFIMCVVLLRHSTVASNASMALRESLGFIDDTEDVWMGRKRVHTAELKRSVLTHRQKGDGRPKHMSDEMWKFVQANTDFYQNRWEPSFHCALAERLGPSGDGGKWLCDPSRIGPGCLVYSFGSNNDFGFEVAIKERLPQCEIHTFDHTIGEHPSNRPSYVSFHALGLAKDVTHSEAEEKLFTLAQHAAMLGHNNRLIEIMKVDIEGMEVQSVQSWVEDAAPTVRQILIETHLAVSDSQNWPSVSSMEYFFNMLASHGYVVTSKEPNVVAAADGGHCCAEYALLKLHPNFATTTYSSKSNLMIKPVDETTFVESNPLGTLAS